MEFKTRVSTEMSLRENGVKLIRIPRDTRAVLGINVGESIDMDTKDGNKIRLKVEQAFLSDVDKDSNVAYVSQSVFDILNLKDVVDSKFVLSLTDVITLGTDPEFFVVNFNRNEVIHPARFFQKYGEVGSDGMLVEIRPHPNVEVKSLVSNMAYCLAKAQKIIREHPLGKDPKVKLAAASHIGGYTAGFHLHYGLPKEILNLYNNRRIVLKEMVRGLDYYVGVPSIIPEGIDDSFRRSNPFVTYGSVGDFRVNYRTLEYRVPGGSLLRHPDLSEGLIGLGALVVEDVVTRVRAATEDFTKLDELKTPEDLNEIYPNVPSMKTLFQTVCVPDVEIAKGQLERIYADVQNMIGYNKRKESVDKFFDSIEKKFSCYIEDNWNLNKINALEQGA